MPVVRLSPSLATLILLVPAAAHAQKQYSLTGKQVAIYNLAGTATVVAGTGSDVVVTATLGGADAGKLTFDVGEVHGRTALRIIYPDNHIVYERMTGHGQTEMSINEDGTFGYDDHHSHSHGDRVRITGSGSGLHAYADLQIAVPEGKDVAVNVGVGRITATNVKGDIKLDTSDGPVDATGITGDLLVDTGSGDVKVTRINGSSVSIDTGSGDVNGTTISAKELLVDTGSGEVSMSDVTADRISLDTGSGNATLAVTNKLTDLKIDTGSGDVTVSLPATTGAHLSVETGSGRVTSDLPISVRHTEEDELVGVIGDGSGKIDIDTGSGNVRLLKN
jgi:lia operon protein LiaG